MRKLKDMEDLLEVKQKVIISKNKEVKQLREHRDELQFGEQRRRKAERENRKLKITVSAQRETNKLISTLYTNSRNESELSALQQLVMEKDKELAELKKELKELKLEVDRLRELVEDQDSKDETEEVMEDVMETKGMNIDEELDSIPYHDGYAYIRRKNGDEEGSAEYIIRGIQFTLLLPDAIGFVICDSRALSLRSIRRILDLGKRLNLFQYYYSEYHTKSEYITVSFDARAKMESVYYIGDCIQMEEIEERLYPQQKGTKQALYFLCCQEYQGGVIEGLEALKTSKVKWNRYEQPRLWMAIVMKENQRIRGRYFEQRKVKKNHKFN